MALATPRRVDRRASCPHCGTAIFYPRECDGRPHKLDLDPVPDGAWVVIAWNAIMPKLGITTTFVAPFDPSHDVDENRYQDHICREKP